MDPASTLIYFIFSRNIIELQPSQIQCLTDSFNTQVGDCFNDLIRID